jgi:hypothetical protein
LRMRVAEVGPEHEESAFDHIPILGGFRRSITHNKLITRE